MTKTLLFALGHYGPNKDEFTTITIERFFKMKELSQIYTDADVVSSGGPCDGNYELGYSWCNEIDYLINRIGIAEERIIGGFVIYNTAEQIFLVHKIAQYLNYDHVIIITSDYHVARAQELIQNIWTSECAVKVEASSTVFANNDLEQHAKEHECVSLENMRSQGFYLNERLNRIKDFPLDKILKN